MSDASDDRPAAHRRMPLIPVGEPVHAVPAPRLENARLIDVHGAR
jgi:hypothetical protein